MKSPLHPYYIPICFQMYIGLYWIDMKVAVNPHVSEFHFIYWLVLWNMNVMTFHISGRIIPTDQIIFFRGVGIPPTSVCLKKTCLMGYINRSRAIPHLSLPNSSRTGDLAHYATATGGFFGWMFAAFVPPRSLFHHDIYPLVN